MSAYLVEAEHINVLLWAAHEGFHRPLGNLTWIFDKPPVGTRHDDAR